MYVIGTAGHVDHGKSTLVKALTGIDPDRLKEEKEREMTIDLGFAWLTLPGGIEVGVVDVPGHHRLVKNMLAGVGGIDLALLVVAADEGVMPQTREHLAILDLLGVTRGVVALTKKDLVDDDWRELIASDVADTLAPTTMAGVPIVAVSSTTGEGLDELKEALAKALTVTEPRRDLGRARLPIDRSFVMTGFGAVVTGTLVDGSLRTGQEVVIVPKGLKARIRGLQSHRRKLEEASPGRRLAVNLSGVSHDELERGDVLATPGWLTATDALDAHIKLVKDAPGPIKHNAPVMFHTGTFETLARVRLLDKNELRPGESAWAQLKLQNPVAVVKGDLFILRNSWGTIGGGQIVEPKAKRHRRFHEPTLERLQVLQAGSPEEVVLETLGATEPCLAHSLIDPTSLSWEQVKDALDALVQSGQATMLTPGDLDRNAVLYTSRGFTSVSDQVQEMLRQFHGTYPIRHGMVKEEVRTRLQLPASAFALVVRRLVEEFKIGDLGPVLQVHGHEISLTPEQKKEADAYLAGLAASPFSPPGALSIDSELLSYLLDEGRVVRTGSDVVFTAEAYREMTDRVVRQIKESGKVTLGEVRDLLGTSRKYVQALLEHLDQQRVTRRVGDERVLR
ncbi:MAG: selenocysteine-specific translation elongation factor [Chloroflexi bacterium]|nr:selenocysteine-specific translation elongation factor [Chloroflexota bacterium]